MFRTSRRFRSLVAVSLFLLAGRLAAEPFGVLHATLDDDPACSPVSVSHDASAHRVEAGQAASPQHAEHCYVCHSLRSFRPLESASKRLPVDTPCLGRLDQPTSTRPGLLATAKLPARSPPA